MARLLSVNGKPIAEVSMGEVAHAITMTIKVKHAKRTRLRLAMFTSLLRLACWVNPCTVVLETDDD